jgi:hypothetical protein
VPAARPSPPPPQTLEAPEVVDRDSLCSILADFVARATDVAVEERSRTVREELDALGVEGDVVPHPLAGQLVVALARRLRVEAARREFLSNAWLILRRKLLADGEAREIAVQG